jgi:hypothetical protein
MMARNCVATACILTYADVVTAVVRTVPAVMIMATTSRPGDPTVVNVSET